MKRIINTFTVLFSSFVVLHAAAAASTTDCESVLGAICQLNGAGPHCHPCLPNSYVVCTSRNEAKVKTCGKGQLWDALLAQCKPDSWVQPQQSKCVPSINLKVPAGFDPKGASASAAAGRRSAGTSAWSAWLSSANDLVNRLSDRLIGAAEQLGEQQQDDAAGKGNLKLAMLNKESSEDGSGVAVAALPSKGSSPGAAASTSGDSAAQTADKVQGLHTALQEAQELRYKAARLSIQATLADEKAAKEVAAIKAALADATDLEEVMPRIEKRVTAAEKAKNIASKLRDKVQELLEISDATAASASQDLNALISEGSPDLDGLLRSGEMLAEDINALLSAPGMTDKGTNGTSANATTTLKQKGGKPAKGSTTDLLLKQHSSLLADSQEDDDYSFFDARASDKHADGSFKDSASSAHNFMQKLMADQASKLIGLADGKEGDESGSVTSDNILKGTVLQPLINSNNIFSLEQLLGGSSSDDGNTGRSEDEAAVDEALSQQRQAEEQRQLAVERDELDNIPAPSRIIEELARGMHEEKRAVEQEAEESSNAVSPWRMVVPLPTLEEQAAMEETISSLPEPAASTDRAVKHEQAPQQPSHDASSKGSTTPSKSIALAARFHDALMTAAAERLQASADLANIFADPPVVRQRELQVEDLVHFFDGVYHNLNEGGRTALTALDPTAAFDIIVAAGTPVAVLNPSLSQILRAPDSASLGDLLTAQALFISELLASKKADTANEEESLKAAESAEEEGGEQQQEARIMRVDPSMSAPSIVPQADAVRAVERKPSAAAARDDTTTVVLVDGDDSKASDNQIVIEIMPTSRGASSQQDNVFVEIRKPAAEAEAAASSMTRSARGPMLRKPSNRAARATSSSSSSKVGIASIGQAQADSSDWQQGTSRAEDHVMVASSSSSSSSSKPTASDASTYRESASNRRKASAASQVATAAAASADSRLLANVVKPDFKDPSFLNQLKQALTDVKHIKPANTHAAVLPALPTLPEVDPPLTSTAAGAESGKSGEATAPGKQ